MAGQASRSAPARAVRATSGLRQETSQSRSVSPAPLGQHRLGFADRPPCSHVGPDQPHRRVQAVHPSGPAPNQPAETTRGRPSARSATDRRPVRLDDHALRLRVAGNARMCRARPCSGRPAGPAQPVLQGSTGLQPLHPPPGYFLMQPGDVPGTRRSQAGGDGIQRWGVVGGWDMRSTREPASYIEPMFPHRWARRFRPSRRCAVCSCSGPRGGDLRFASSSLRNPSPGDAPPAPCRKASPIRPGELCAPDRRCWIARVAAVPLRIPLVRGRRLFRWQPGWAMVRCVAVMRSTPGWSRRWKPCDRCCRCRWRAPPAWSAVFNQAHELYCGTGWPAKSHAWLLLHLGDTRLSPHCRVSGCAMCGVRSRGAAAPDWADGPPGCSGG